MTLAQLRQQIETITGLNDSATAFNRAINATYRELVASRRWSWLEEDSEPLVIVANGMSVALPADHVRTIHVTLEDPTATTEFLPFDYVTPAEYRQLRTEVYGDTPGVPVVWTRFGNFLDWLPKADATYAGFISYTKDPPDLAADGDTPLLPATHHDVLVWGAARILARRQLNKEIAALADSEYERQRINLVHADGIRQQQTSTRVVDSGFFTELESH